MVRSAHPTEAPKGGRPLYRSEHLKSKSVGRQLPVQSPSRRSNLRVQCRASVMMLEVTLGMLTTSSHERRCRNVASPAPGRVRLSNQLCPRHRGRTSFRNRETCDLWGPSQKMLLVSAVLPLLTGSVSSRSPCVIVKSAGASQRTRRKGDRPLVGSAHEGAWARRPSCHPAR